MYGWSDFSDSLYLIAAAVPDPTDAVVTSNEDIQIKIQWIVILSIIEPAYNGGVPLYGFKITVQ